ncbi:N-ethylammeline chlorohydrolase [Reticulibacter mediterranei]|uniref:N-ethylammeline chlorohydrolase n=1 Tax=Reticulibacter mediterranei TaxID=2778369 RepID=A0A8J3N462_9CHLR|nr:amidohydrolase [Reticulibacter mediterranei]GHO97867.1 N-ethylammeline chlorohydrolase [Reticulibacter mediterranei]
MQYTEQLNRSSLPDNEAPHTLIRGCALLSPYESGRLHYDQDILIVGNRIQAVGPSGTLEYNPFRLDRILSGKGRLVMPGLVNSHTHSLENLLHATSPSLPLELWLIPLFSTPVEWTPNFVYLSALLGAIEMLKSGTTAVLDHLWTHAGVELAYLDATMQAYSDAGIRATVAPSIEDQDLVLEEGPHYGIEFPEHPFIQRFDLWPSIDRQMNTLGDFMSIWHDAEEGRLRCMPGPSGIHWCSPNLLQRCQELAQQYKTGMHLHAVETELQAAVIRKQLGQGGIAYLDKMGVLQPGTSLAHAIWLEDGDLNLLAKTGATVVHNPVSNLRLGSGRFPFIEALNQGVSVALGSDGSASNDRQNMFDVLKLTGLIHNHPNEDYKKWPRPVEILESATQGGAAALGRSGEVGEIQPGQLADLVLLDLEATPFVPLRDACLHLVYCENGSSVDTVIVNGNVVVEGGTITTVDEQAIRDEIREQCDVVWPGFSAQLDNEDNTREVLARLDTLRRLVLHREE